MRYNNIILVAWYFPTGSRRFRYIIKDRTVPHTVTVFFYK